MGFPIDLETPSSHPLDASLLATIAESLEHIQHAGDSTNTGALAFDKLEQHFAAHGTFQYGFPLVLLSSTMLTLSQVLGLADNTTLL